MDQLHITAEGTPNPNTVKFKVNRTLIENGTGNFATRESAQGSLLPLALFEIDAVESVFVGKSFISITKTHDASWDALIPVTDRMKEVLDSGQQLLLPESITPAFQSEGDSVIAQQIIDILDREIRPAVARDGGDITFEGYENGVVMLHLQGACSSCPSAAITLKMGVESMLKQHIPEVREVMQV